MVRNSPSLHLSTQTSRTIHRVKRLLNFFISAGKWGIALMTGGVAAYLVAAYEHIAGHSLTAFVWVTLGIALFMVGAFLAWNEQFNKAILSGNPEIVIEYEKSAKHITAALFVKSLGGGNAYRLKIRDITNSAGAVVTFSEVSHLENRQMYEAKGTFENFKEFAPYFSHNFDSFLMDAKEGQDVVESISNTMAPKTIRVTVDYFNTSDMRFTAEFEIRRSLEEAHTLFLRRYFNPA
jgi:hypothetical protein